MGEGFFPPFLQTSGAALFESQRKMRVLPPARGRCVEGRRAVRWRWEVPEVEPVMAAGSGWWV